MPVIRAYNHNTDYSDRPTALTLSALRVEWQKPDLDALGNICTIRGQLKMQHAGQPQPTPITWFQGVTVYLAMTPGARPDWSKGMQQRNTAHQTAVTSPCGKFQMRFDLRKTNQDRSNSQPFQFGVALAVHTVSSKTSHVVDWSSQIPAIPATVALLTIPAAKRLSHELELINRASRWPFSDPNGTDLTRAVNVLQPLGKARALAVLERYAELTRSIEYDSDEAIVFRIIRVLFKPLRIDERLPSPAVGVFLDDRKFPTAMKWPLNPIEVVDDVPFMVGSRISSTGTPERPSSHIHWARLHGVIRDAKLAPTANPKAAAEAILLSARFKALENFARDQATMQIRWQALAMAGETLNPIYARTVINDDQWKARLKAVADRGIHWDMQREQFVRRD